MKANILADETKPKSRAPTDEEKKWLKSRFGQSLDPGTLSVEIDDALSVPDDEGNIVLGQTREGFPGIIYLNPSIEKDLGRYDDPGNKDLYAEAVRAHEWFHVWQEQFQDHWQKVASDRENDKKTNAQTYDFKLSENTKLLEMSKERQASAMQNFEIRLKALGNPDICVEAFRLKQLLQQELPMKVALPCEGFPEISNEALKRLQEIQTEFSAFPEKNNYLVFLMRGTPTAAKAIAVDEILRGGTSRLGITKAIRARMQDYVRREDVREFIYQKRTHEPTYEFSFSNASSTALIPSA